MKPWQYAVIGVVVGVVLAVVWGFMTHRTTIAPTLNNANRTAIINSAVSNSSNSNSTSQTDTSFFSTNDLPERDATLNFSASLPSGWVAEYVAGSLAINFYDPDAVGATSLDKSQIFIKYFEAAGFQTLTTVDIKSRNESTINDRPAVTYVIQKKDSVAVFSNQPSWRNLEHTVTDIRSADTTPATFYVFAKSPGLSAEVFNTFLKSVSFNSVGAISQVVWPMQNFVPRVNHKYFGQYITPQNSPIQPERFSGYHTGADAEVFQDETLDIPVYAIADGKIKLAQMAQGYGGVIVIEHTVGDQTITAVYGHVRLSSIQKPVGQTVRRAEPIAFLGTGGSSETDGARQHLHFGIVKSGQIELLGYVPNQNQLTDWHDPLVWMVTQGASEPTAV